MGIIDRFLGSEEKKEVPTPRKTPSPEEMRKTMKNVFKVLKEGVVDKKPILPTPGKKHHSAADGSFLESRKRKFGIR